MSQNKITLEYVGRAIDELIDFFGIKEDAPSARLKSLVTTTRITDCIKAIASYLGLPVSVNLSYVSDTYDKSSTGGFTSSGLVSTDQAGRGTQSITAQVSVPTNLPFYSSDGMKTVSIDVKVSENCITQPMSFIAIIAHELTHIVLRSLWHKEKENEYYTDMTAMVLGFSKIMQEGRKSVVTKDNVQYTTTYGYLSDEQFSFAFKKIRSILDDFESLRNGLLYNIRTAMNEVERFKSSVSVFDSLLVMVDNERYHDITPEDMHKIMIFHQPSYIEEFKLPLEKAGARVKEIQILSNQFIHYNRQNFIQLQLHEREMRDLVSEIRSRCNLIDDNIRILKKHTGKRYNIKSRLKRLMSRIF